MSSYSIKIQNRTGGAQDYSFFSDRPAVSGGMSGDLWSNVLKSVPRTPNGGTAQFQVSTNYYAIVGNFDGDANHGGRISVSKSAGIKLGSKNGSNITPGSSVSLTVYDKSSGDLGNVTTPGQGKIGNFSLDTSLNGENAFTFQDAKNNNLFVGIATGRGDGDANALGTFTPYPNARYQISPASVFYVTAGERFSTGDLVKVEMIGNSIAVDFIARGTNSVTIIHDETGQFYFD